MEELVLQSQRMMQQSQPTQEQLLEVRVHGWALGPPRRWVCSEHAQPAVVWYDLSARSHVCWHTLGAACSASDLHGMRCWLQAVLDDPAFRDRVTRMFNVRGSAGQPPPELECRSS